MHQTTQSSKISRPEFIIDETASEIDKDLLNRLLPLYYEHPALAIQGINLVVGPTTNLKSVLDIYDIFKDDGMRTLKLINTAWSVGSDKELTFDKQTEYAIENNPTVIELRKIKSSNRTVGVLERQNSPNDAERMRYNRLKIALGRISLYDRQQIK